jgi:hypothetical protein
MYSVSLLITFLKTYNFPSMLVIMNTGGAGVVVLGGSESSSILVQKSGLL